ncbi:hypothetical protein VCUG_01978 [Vavraia culicis subsp. floridensis]|uniref:Uncharacterized protein n=1 Tax=Vavraia culicis (isolate floridensis) TaxID=948595 RepID=L2GTX3_VAVCU|nr:uncharacterized protein VCUG_01978 [Vavraia culicis subsp. floridensis]ELA46545.1 hypothetical protein VCUG_01978 [Vavraia culicis subsp. floridensis]
MDDTYVKFVITHRFVLKLVPTMNRSALLTGGIVTGTLPNQNVSTGRVKDTLPNQNVSTGRVTGTLPKYCFTHLNEYFGPAKKRSTLLFVSFLPLRSNSQL